MSISMHIDEYMARRGIVPDDTVVVDDPCAEFDGATETTDPRERLEETADAVRDLLG